MLNSPDDVSETLCNVLDKVCVTFGASEYLSPDGESTEHNLSCGFFILTP